jgi:alkylation response protein AidB-like acyl-CoA dehydrogenase
MTGAVLGSQAQDAVSSEELAQIVEVAREFARAVPGKLWFALDEQDKEAIDRSWNELCEIGLERALLAEDAGGIGLADGMLATIVEALAVGDGGVALLMLGSNIALTSLPAPRLSELASGARFCFVPVAGARQDDPTAPKLVDGRVNGEARFVLGAAGATGYVVACRDGDETVLVELASDAAGLMCRELDDQLGLRGAKAATLTFHDVPATRVGGAEQAERASVLLHAGIGAIARGAAQRASELAHEYAENRYQGGGPIIIHGAVRDMLARIDERRLGMAPPEAGPLELPQALARKIALSDAAVESTIDAVQVFGGMGYMHETGVEKLMRDAKYCQLYPTPNWIAREALLATQR